MRPDRACIPRLDADNPRLNHDPALAGGTTACCHRSLRITAANARAGEIGSPARLPRSDFVRDLADALDVADGLAAAAVTDPAQLDPEFILSVRHGRSPSKAHPCGAHLRCVKTATFFVNVEKALSLEVATTPSTLTTILGCADKALSAFRRQCFYLALPIPCCAPRCPLKKRDEDARRFAARVTNADVMRRCLSGLFVRIPGPQRPRDAKNVAPQHRTKISGIERMRMRLQQEEFTIDQLDAA